MNFYLPQMYLDFFTKDDKPGQVSPVVFCFMKKNRNGTKTKAIFLRDQIIVKCTF